MANDILKVKIHIPPLGKQILVRTKIFAQLEQDVADSQGFTRKLTLVSAPAGFGKTTVVRSWIAGREQQTAWYAIDDADNAREQFWLYLLSAIQTINKSVGAATMEMLRSMDISSEAPSSLLTPVLNDLFSLETPFFLVLDDYHLINNRQIHDDLIFFIENAGPALHVIVTTRSDPPWPLSKLRAKGMMNELRLEDLKFSKDEMKQLLFQINSFELPENQLETLYNKTEGWVTGIQLAALSIASSSDTNKFINDFAGSDRFVLHFLSEEVLSGQAPVIQDFLLKTSILNRLCAPLCDAVTGRNDSSEILADLERNNLFIIALDNQGYWYRYHHLFSDLLSHRLKAISTDTIKQLHTMACNWYVAAGAYREALHHAFASDNKDKVAEILHDYDTTILQEEGTTLLIRYLNSLPLNLLQKYQRLIAYKAFYHIAREGSQEAEKYLAIARTLSYKDAAKQQEYLGIQAVINAFHSINTQNILNTKKYAEEALRYLPPGNHFWRNSVTIISGDAMLFSGRPNEAYPFYLEAHQNNQRCNQHYFLISSGIKLAINLQYLGELAESEAFIQSLLMFVKEKGLGNLGKVGILWALLGDILREKGDYVEAERCIERGLYLSRVSKPYLSWNLLYRIALAYSQGKNNQAMAAIRQIEALNNEFQLPTFIITVATAWKARILIERADITQARNLLSELGVKEDVPVKGGQEQVYLVLVRLLLAEDNKDLGLVRTILDDIQRLANSGEQRQILIETLILKASLEKKAGNLASADNLIQNAKNIGTAKFNPSAENKPHSENKTSYPSLIEDLSPRELEIVELISQGLSNQDIANKLFISLGTVKWHTSNIYGKLGVRGRTHAVAAARKLKLIR
ncbi:LuxR C-terminal-related transcriptional regulator [Desulfuribacillus alkaliarsenatis]|uniref:HTH luxR-type domain-containing protein n=1 Tax=Desulfuribacillus alkaliarsenatis TaxID=766136 RepID=A0A1E5G2M2_9FIRM|nr:LuxR C-terminal-related transcriptional regulator [Desulfuribacillus alkaliarsenatis]OEF97133.1 hypothetical protein BHF68_05930 [Desulfuribacillus alkaliarsenatis]